MKKPFVIGLTGCTGAGKTTALAALRDLGAYVLDCDEEYHAMLRTDGPMLAELAGAFPEAFRDGALDRKALGRIVFQDEEKLAALSRLTHRHVAARVRQKIEACGRPWAVIDAVALLESGLSGLCRLTVAVTAPEEQRAERIMRREGISREYAMLRIRAQKDGEWFARRCDAELVNDCASREAFYQRARDWFQKKLKEESAMENGEMLFYRRKSAYDRVGEEEKQDCERYCSAYKDYLNAAKTEREACREAIRLAEAKGFRPLASFDSLQPGDKVYYLNQEKALLLAVIGTESMQQGVHIAAAHVDAPRLDLKQVPLYEDNGVALFKTHYYGGVKKYQWVTIPLEIRGVIAKKDGQVIPVQIGRDPADPVLVITDLLPHLSADQNKKTMAEGIPAENLNLMAGTRPTGEGDERVKRTVLQLLHEKYGVTEEDLISAELEAVPALDARDAGLDRSLIAAYGHDDRVCAFAELQALLETESPRKTAVCILADKEEIGSMGVTGMQSQVFEWFIRRLCTLTGQEGEDCLVHSFCLSADVTAAFDPTYPEVSEKNNAALLNRGVALSKFTGRAGKSGTSDASAETVAKVRRIFDDSGVVWQMAEMGRVDQGGGGTVAMFMANRGIDTLDAGVPVLSMHAPYEMVAKMDCYMTYRGVKALYNAGC